MIKNVLLCGLGAIGSIYANKISKNKNFDLRILVDENRLERYSKNPKFFNGEIMNLEYILPQNSDFKADLIIISTKFSGLDDVIKNIKNFITPDTIIISLLNGIISEEIIAEEYGWKNILTSYYIGHSAMRQGNKIEHDGIGYIVFGVADNTLTDVDNIDQLKTFFEQTNIQYNIPQDIKHSLWRKFMLNVAANQSSAILKMNFGQIRENPNYMKFLENVMLEVQQIAKVCKVNNSETLTQEAMTDIQTMIPEGKTSMLQDIEAGRQTEVDIFAGTIIELGKKYNISTPYNKIMKEMIEIISYRTKTL